MILYILIALAVVIAGFVIVVLMQPANFTTTRSATIPVPASVLFEEVNDFHRWEAWSPWARMDPNAKNTFEGAPAGVGSVFAWESKKTGQGRMTLVESRADQLIRIKLEFLKPFVATNTAEFTFKPMGDATVVTWSMSGTRNFVLKAMGLLINCDKMCGDQFEQGLSNLQSVVTSETATVKA